MAENVFSEDMELRTELCLHTTTSASASLITPRQLVEDALAMGVKAVAITDDDSVQSFPELARWLRQYNSPLKVIYGTEILLSPGEFANILVKDQEGLKPLYKLISGKPVTEQEREHLLLGVHDLALLSKLAHAKDEEEFSRLAKGYDYIELVPYHYDPGFIQQNKNIYAMGKRTRSLYFQQRRGFQSSPRRNSKNR